MEQFVLTCCSTADRTENFFALRNIPYACFHYMMAGREYPDDLGQTISFKDFYEAIRRGATPTTSQVNSIELLAMWEPYAKDGKDILHVTLSSGLSGVYNSAIIAREQLKNRYPDCRVELVDSLGASAGYGLLVEYLADLRDSGATLTEAKAWAEENKLKIHHWFFSTDLTSYKRGGRISNTEAFIGNMLNICPVMNMDNEGHLIPRYKIRTKRKAIKKMFELMQEHIQDGADYTGKCTMSHSDCYDDAAELATLIEEGFPQLKGKISINSVGTVIGSHTGPGTVALFFMGDTRVE